MALFFLKEINLWGETLFFAKFCKRVYKKTIFTFFTIADIFLLFFSLYS